MRTVSIRVGTFRAGCRADYNQGGRESGGELDRRRKRTRDAALADEREGHARPVGQAEGRHGSV